MEENRRKRDEIEHKAFVKSVETKKTSQALKSQTLPLTVESQVKLPDTTQHIEQTAAT